MREETFNGVGGLSIFFRSWEAVGEKRGVVVIAHGFNSHSGQYGWVGSELAAGGFAVYAIDHRGRGKSEGERFYVDTFGDYVSDLATLVAMIRTREPARRMRMCCG